MQRFHTSLLGLLLLAASSNAQPPAYLDLAPFGRTTTLVNGGTQAVVIEWDDERDVSEIHARFDSTPPGKVSIEYWFRNWPYPPPRMPTMEDPVDDLWQGKWLVAQSSQQCHDSECVYSFEPLSESENPLAKNLPGSHYRRTLKVRLAYTADRVAVSSLQVFSESRQVPV